jgi:hypothetical protein
MTQTKGYKRTKDGGAIIHPKVVGSKDSIRIPQVSTSLGAGFGDEISDSDREFAAEREPVAHFIVYGVAADVIDKWFHIDDVDTEKADPKLDQAFQKALHSLHAKRELLKALELERLHGWSLIVGGFSDAQDTEKLRIPKRNGSQLLQLAVYPKTAVHVESKDENPASPRFGEPIIYRLDRGGGKYLFVHYTRCKKAQTRTNGKSVLDPIWDDITCGRNIRWAAAQWMYRYGSGFPVIKFPAGTTYEQLEDYESGGAFSDIMSRTYLLTVQNSIAENDGMDINFIGAEGKTLNPKPFFETNDEQISKGTGIPQPKLVGAQAGAVTGSELNQQEYYKIISRIQSFFEDSVRWVIDSLIESRQVKITRQQGAPDKIKKVFRRFADGIKHIITGIDCKQIDNLSTFDYNIVWNSPFELSEIDETQVALQKAQADQIRLQYMTVDEVRALNDLDPLPDGQGATLATKSQPQNTPFSFFNQNKDEAPPSMKEAHPSLPALLKHYAAQYGKGEIDYEEAYNSGAEIIAKYNELERQRAQAWVQARTGKTAEVSPEMSDELEAQKTRYLENWKKMLEDIKGLKK